MSHSGDNGNGQQNDFGSDVRREVNLIVMLVRVHATCLTVFTRTGFGTEYPGFLGVLAVPLMLLYMCWSGDIRMMHYFEAWFLALVVQRIRTFRQWNRGHREHSFYEGRPWLVMLFPNMTTEAKALRVEPLLCAFIGVVLATWSPAVGGFVIAGAFSLGLSHGVAQFTHYRRVKALYDMRIEQRFLAEELRKMESNQRRQFP